MIEKLMELLGIYLDYRDYDVEFDDYGVLIVRDPKGSGAVRITIEKWN